MSPSPDWYPDPTDPARLRYWDGVTWTQWVSTDGDTSEDPVSGPSPAPPIEGRAGWSGAPAEPATRHQNPYASAPSPGASTPAAEGGASAQPAPSAADPAVDPRPAVAPPRSEAPPTSAPTPVPLAADPPPLGSPGPIHPTGAGDRYSTSVDQILLRGGLVVAALGGIIATFSFGQTAASQDAFVADLLEKEVGGGVFVALVGAVLILAGAGLPWLWGQLAGIGVASLTAVGLAFAVITLRTDDFLVGPDVSLGSGGWILLAGSLIAFVGLAIALLGLGLRQPPPSDREPESGKGVAALVLGIGGFPVPFLGPLGVAFGLLGMAEARAARTRRGLAIAGFVVGLVAISLWTLGLTLGMFLAEPSND